MRFRCYYCTHEEDRQTTIPPHCKTCRVSMEFDAEPPKPCADGDGEQLDLFGSMEAT